MPYEAEKIATLLYRCRPFGRKAALLTFPWVDSMVTMGFTLGPLACGYDWDLVICWGQRGSSGVPRVVEGRPLACPQSCPKGSWRLAGPGWRLRHRAATPKAPLTWEGRPRRLRGAAGGAHRNDTRARKAALDMGILYRAIISAVGSVLLLCSSGTSESLPTNYSAALPATYQVDLAWRPSSNLGACPISGLQCLGGIDVGLYCIQHGYDRSELRNPYGINDWYCVHDNGQGVARLDNGNLSEACRQQYHDERAQALTNDPSSGTSPKCYVVT